MFIQRAWITVGLAVFLCLFTACGGGGGGGGSAVPVTPTFFSVLTVSPASGTREVPNNFSPSVTFNSSVEQSTINADSIYITKLGSAGKLTGVFVLSSNSRKVTFEPNPWMETSTDYVFTVNDGVRSTFGDTLSTPIKSRYRTANLPSPEGVTQGMFTVLDGPLKSMVARRARHTSTLLPKANVLPSDYVLLTGGYSTANSTTAAAELFDVSRGEFLAIGGMKEKRANHTATFLPDGAVLIVGGEVRIGEVLASAEFYFPANGVFTSAPGMSQGRSEHTATLLADGRVLVTGGKAYDQDGFLDPLATGEVYDPIARTWTPVANNMSIWRYGHQATLLPSGYVMISGGGFFDDHRTADIYDPVRNRFTPVATQSAAPRWNHNSLWLTGTSRLLLTDGGDQEGELYTPTPTADTGSYRTIDSADSLERFAASAFEFRPGEVLILGGFEILGSGDWFLHSTMEIYVENQGATGKYFQVSGFPDNGVYLADPRVYSGWTRLPRRPTETLHRFLITGGLGNGDQNLNTALLFNPNAE